MRLAGGSSQKKDEPADPDAPEAAPVEEENPEKPPAEEPVDQTKPETKLGQRILSPQFIEYDFKFLCDTAKKTIPEPLWPDPDKEPLPPPVIH